MIGAFSGISIGYDDIGTGLPVVFLHGFPHNRTLWAPQLGALTVPARTVAMDLRGFGDSPGAATTMDDYANDVAVLIQGLGISQAVIAGISMGGYVALALWRLHPELIRALVLCDTKAGPDDAAARLRRDEHIALVEAKGSTALGDQLIRSQLGKSTREGRPEIRERIYTMLSMARVTGSVGALTAMRDRVDSRPTLATITVPTLIVVGDEDVVTPVAEARAMQAGIAGSDLEVIAGAGHLSVVERPASFNHVLGEFLATLAYS